MSSATPGTHPDWRNPLNGTSMPTSPLRPLLGEVHDVGYVVDDLVEVVATAARITGTGLSFSSEHVTVGEVMSAGAPATFDHSAGEGSPGSAPV